MSNTPSQLVFWPHFERELKRLKRKYPSLNKDTHYSTAPHCQTDGCPEIPPFQSMHAFQGVSVKPCIQIEILEY